ncbi:hypothetical protein METY_2788 [Methylopila sp. Yamaguchi]|nr:hypothetical protein METY_2788 [Methylopila sp. Yamaguchi]
MPALRSRLQTFTTSANWVRSNKLPLEGNIVKREWLRFYDEAPRELDLGIASWNTALTLSEAPDWSVGTVWGAKGLDFYLLKCLRIRAMLFGRGHNLAIGSRPRFVPLVAGAVAHENHDADDRHCGDNEHDEGPAVARGRSLRGKCPDLLRAS